MVLADMSAGLKRSEAEKSNNPTVHPQNYRREKPHQGLVRTGLVESKLSKQEGRHRRELHLVGERMGQYFEFGKFQW